MNLFDFRGKYPQYDKVSDQDLADGLYGKFYADKMPRDDFYKTVGFNPGSSAIENLKSEYPGLDTSQLEVRYSVDGKDHRGEPAGNRKMEFYPPDEDYNFAKGKPAIEVFDRGMKTRDMMGELFSHHLPKVDPEFGTGRQKFLESLTPEQKEGMLKPDYEAYIQDMPEDQQPPFSDWLANQGGDAFFRGYVTKQYPADAYTPEQKQLLSTLLSRLTQKPPPAAPGDSFSTRMSRAYDAMRGETSSEILDPAISRGERTAAGGRAPEARALPDEPLSLKDRIRNSYRAVIGEGPYEPTQEDVGAKRAQAFVQQYAEANNMTPDQVRTTMGGMSEVPKQFAQGFVNDYFAGLAPNQTADPDTTAGNVARGLGTLGGFIVGAPLAVAEKATAATVGRFFGAKATDPRVLAIAKDMVKHASTLGIASAITETGEALDEKTLHEALQKYSDALESGAKVGAVFGMAGQVFRDGGTLNRLGRIASINIGLDAVNGTRPTDDRPLWQKVYDYGLNAFFGWNGAGRGKVGAPPPAEGTPPPSIGGSTTPPGPRGGVTIDVAPTDVTYERDPRMLGQAPPELPPPGAPPEAAPPAPEAPSSSVGASPVPSPRSTPPDRDIKVAAAEQANEQAQADAVRTQATETPLDAAEQRKADVRLARSQKAAERHAAESAIKPEADDLLTAIAKAGGISREEAEKAGIDPAEFNRRGWKIKRVFTGGGRSFEAMSEHLAQMGYPVVDEAGQYGENAMRDAIDRALHGEKLHTQAGAVRAAETTAQTAEQEHDDWTNFLNSEPALEDPEYDGLDTHGQMALLDAHQAARDAGVPEDDIEALIERGAIRGLSNEEIIQAIQDRTTGERGRPASAVEGAGQPSEGAYPEEALTSYSAEDLAARESQKKAAADARAAEDQKAAADAERDSFTLTGSDRTADVAASRGQQGLFDQKPAQAAAAPEPPVPSGHVRVYHSGSAGEGTHGRWVSTDRRYAADYRKDQPLFYTDVPEADPRVNNPDYPDTQGVKQGFTFNFELTPAEAKNLKETARKDSPIDAAAHEAATSDQNDLPHPTDAQKEAGNYAKGHVRIGGVDISIENPSGSRRRPEWPKLKDHYGYIRRTEGADGDHLDVFIKPGTPEDYSGPVFVVDQVDPKTRKFDEHKVMLGWHSLQGAHAGYLGNYAEGWKGLGNITEMSMEGFREWLKKDEPADMAPDTKAPEPAKTPAESKAPADNSADKPIKVATGDRLRSDSGRDMSPVPKVDMTTDRKATTSLRRMDAWLLDEARKEAAGKDYLQTLLQGIDTKNMSTADRDTLNAVLFGDEEGAKARHRVDTASWQERGRADFAAGKKSTIPADVRKEGMAAMDAWEKGWHAANAEAPVEGIPARGAPKGATTVEGYHWKPERPSRDDAVVVLDVAKADALWQKDDGMYVEPGGKGAAIGSRYEQFGEWLNGDGYKNNGAIEMPNVYLTPNGALTFGNGRHRWSWMRDHGVTRIPVTVDPEQVQAFKDAGIVADEAAKPGAAKKPRTPREEALSGEKNTVFTKDKADEALKTLKGLFGRLNTGLDPQMIQALVTRGGYHVERGVRGFAEWAREMVGELGGGVKPYLQWLYKTIAEYPGFNAKGMDDLARLPDVDSVFKAEGENDVPGGSEYAQPYRPDGETAASGHAETVQSRSGRTDGRAGGTGRGAREERAQQQGDSRVPVADAAPAGESRDQPVHQQDGLFDAAGGDARRDERGGRADDSSRGVEADAEAIERAEDDARTDQRSLAEKRAAQRAASSLPVKRGDANNIRETLPFLLDGQHEDVLKTENRFDGTGGVQKGAGILFTNGTGTGKTYSGLGVISRHIRSTGDDNVLIVVPTQPKVTDWIADGGNLDVPITALDNKRDKGTGVVITTYANFRDNWWLPERDFSLVVYDESHYLKSAADDEALALQQHRALARHPRGLLDLAYRRDPVSRDLEMTRRKFVQDAVQKDIDEMATRYESWGRSKEDARAQAERAMNPEQAAAVKKRANEDFHKDHAEEFRAAYERAKEESERMRERYPEPANVVFLSASPFPYHFSLDYAEGFLFDYGQKEGSGYNAPDGRDAFYMQNLGYRKRYNKLTKPDAEVDQSLMERQLSERLKKAGVLSGRLLDTGFDYSRQFVKVDDEVGKQIDRGYMVLSGYKQDEAGDWKHDDRYKLLPQVMRKKFTHTYLMQLREGIGARNVAARIDKHLAMGRKVVVFHDYRKPPGSHPFDLSDLAGSVEANNEIRMFHEEHPDLRQMPLNALLSVVDEIRSKYGNRAVFINGTEGSKAKSRAKALFNDDASGVDVIVVQRLSGREGISLHDVTGKRQRALVDLGLPIAPVDAIQTEGRINRFGVKSNAVIEYPVLHTSFERNGFFYKTSERSSTAENLAMGELARGLKMAFRQGYQDYYEGDPSMDQGTGGMKTDRSLATDSPYRIAIGLYMGTFSQKGKRRDQRAGKDYYATPEPVGFKMVEWAGIRRGEDVLEPSAGHGAIARFFPEGASATAVEPSYALQDQLQAVFDGRRVNSNFEDFHVTNKYDAIVMNPPFGNGGSLAVKHLDKAVKHLREGGRIVALIPEGGAANKAFDKWYDEVLGVYKVAEFGLPPATFERAGAAVKTRIVVLDKWEGKDAPKNAGIGQERREIDASSTKELFDKIEHMDVPPRLEKAEETKVSDKTGRPSAERPADAPAEGLNVAIEKGTHTKTGADIWYARLPRVERDVYDRANKVAKDLGGYYSTYRGGGAKPGFVFKTEAEAKTFARTIEGGKFARRDVTPMERIDTANGPLFTGEHISLFPVSQDPATGKVDYTVVDSDGHGVGELVLGVEDDAVTRAYAIHLDRGASAMVAARVVRGLLNTIDRPIEVRDIVNPDLLRVLRKMGLRDETDGESHGSVNGYIDPRGERGSEARDGAQRGEAEGGEPAGAGAAGAGEAPGLTPERTREYLEQRAGRGLIRRLVDRDQLLLIPTTDARTPQAVRDALADGPVHGYYDPATGRSYIFTDQVNDTGAYDRALQTDDAYGTLLHEIGVHHGLPAMLGQKTFDAMARAVGNAARGKANTPLAIAARRAAAEVDPETPDQYRDEETLAFVVGNAANRHLPLWQRAWTKLRAWLYRMGWRGNVAPDVLVELARGAAARAGGRWIDRGRRFASRTAEMFYSQALRAIETAKVGKATFEQWTSLLKKSGVKDEELKWLGWNEFDDATMHLKVIPRDHVEAFIREGQVEVFEVVKGNAMPEWRQRMDLLLTRGPTNLTPSEYAELNELRDRHDNEGPHGQDDTNHSAYVTPGGKDYHELLLTTPTAGAVFTPYSADGKWMASTQDGKFIQNGFESREAAEAWYAAHAADVEPSAFFSSSHWDEPNIVAHIRFNTRQSADGKRVMFLEEVQSDWHQTGRKKGYRPAEWEPVDTSGYTLERFPDGTARVRDQDRMTLMHGSAQHSDEELMAAAAEAAQHMRDRRDAKLPPRGPFEKSWPLLAFKRAIRWAAENGMDRVAWTTGTMQAQRYGLAGTVEHVRYIDKGNGLYDVWAAGDWGGSISEEMDWKDKDIDYIEAQLGPEIARQVREGEGDLDSSAVGESNKFPERVLDLANPIEIGGEGMKGFYDRILPAEVNKYVKQWGAKVAPAEVDTGMQKGPPRYQGRIPTEDEIRLVHDHSMGSVANINAMYSPITGARLQFPLQRVAVSQQVRMVLNSVTAGESFEVAMGQNGSPSVAEIFGGEIVYPDGAPTKATVLGFDITPAMRDSAMKGQPLFSRSLRAPAAPRVQPGQGFFARRRARAGDLFPNGGFDLPSESVWDHIVRNLQDRFRRVKVLQHSMTEAGIRIPDEHNAYLAEELYRSRSAERLADFETDHVEPLLAEMTRNDVTLDELDDYLYAKHAQERNEHIAGIRPDLADGGSGMTDADARAILDRFVDRPEVQDMAEKVWAMNRARVDLLEREGLESAKTLKVWRDQYQHYVPLRGFRDEEDSFVPGRGKGFDVRGKESRQALGRRSKADSPTLYSIAQMEVSIIRAEKNRVGRRFLDLVLTNPSELWSVNKVNMGDFKPVFDKKAGEVVFVRDRSGRHADNVVSVKRDGKEYLITLHDDGNLLARAFKMMGPDNANIVVRALATFNRYLAAVSTSFSPEFVLTNFARDLQTAMINLVGEQDAQGALREPKEMGRKVFADIPKAMRGIFDAVYKRNPASEWVRHYDDFRRAGGKVSFIDMRDFDAQRRRIQRLMREAKGDRVATALRMSRALLDHISKVNGVVENATRLATFVNARRAGLSRDQAASLALNVTVNFHRKGEWGTVMNSLYLFYNAGVQGSARMLYAVTRSPRVRKIMGMIAVAAFLWAMMNRWMGGKDDADEWNYDKVRDFTKQRNIMLQRPDGSAWKFPLPYGYNVPWVAGTFMEKAIFGKGKPIESAGAIVGAILDSFNPLGTGDATNMWRWLAKESSPTITDPVLELAMNEDWAGRKIRPDQPDYGPPKPDSQMYFNSVSTPSRVMAGKLNEWTGGDEVTAGAIDLNPESMDYLVRFFTGGMGDALSRTLDLPFKAAEGDEIPSRAIPFYRRFHDDAPEFYDQERYHEIKNASQLAKARHKAYSATGNDKGVDRVETENARDLEMGGAVKGAEKKLRALYAERRRIQSDKSLTTPERKARLRELRDRQTEVQRGVIRQYNEAR